MWVFGCRIWHELHVIWLALQFTNAYVDIILCDFSTVGQTSPHWLQPPHLCIYCDFKQYMCVCWFALWRFMFEMCRLPNSDLAAANLNKFNVNIQLAIINWTSFNWKSPNKKYAPWLLSHSGGVSRLSTLLSRTQTKHAARHIKTISPSLPSPSYSPQTHAQGLGMTTDSRTRSGP